MYTLHNNIYVSFYGVVIFQSTLASPEMLPYIFIKCTIDTHPICMCIVGSFGMQFSFVCFLTHLFSIVIYLYEFHSLSLCLFNFKTISTLLQYAGCLCMERSHWTCTLNECSSSKASRKEEEEGLQSFFGWNIFNGLVCILAMVINVQHSRIIKFPS